MEFQVKMYPPHQQPQLIISLLCLGQILIVTQPWMKNVYQQIFLLILHFMQKKSLCKPAVRIPKEADWSLMKKGRFIFFDSSIYKLDF